MSCLEEIDNDEEYSGCIYGEEEVIREINKTLHRKIKNNEG